MWFDKLLESLKLGPKPLSTALLACAIFLALPKVAIEFLALSSLMGTARPWVASVAIVAGAGLCVQAPVAAYRHIVARRTKHAQVSARLDRLHHLTPQETTFLAGYVERQTRTRLAEQDDDVSLELARSGVIVRLTERPTNVGFHIWAIEDWAWSYLNANRTLLGFKPGSAT